MKKSISSAKKLLAMLLCFLMAFSCFAISGVFASDHVHSYGEWVTVTEATCKQEGLKRKTCVICSQSIEDVIAVKKDGHVIEGEWTVTQQASCNATGTKTNTCSLCGELVTEKIPMTDHSFDNTKWEITKDIVHGEGMKTENGFRVNFCTVCNEKVTETIEVVHSFGDSPWKEATPATCVAKGVSINTCIVCGDAVSEYTEIDPDGHRFSAYPEVVVAPTCQSAGSGYNKCSNCGKVVEVEIPIDYDDLQHSFDYNDTIVYECDRVMVKCTTCNEYVISDTEHAHTVYGEWTILSNPSCTRKGQKQGICSVCGKTVTVNIPVDETAHTYSGWTTLITPTCEKEGLRVRVCINNYGHKQYETLDTLAHKYKTDWTITEEATCQKEGSRTNYCVSCEKDIVEVIPVDAEAHDLTSEWVRTKDPTCTEEGTETNSCTYCGVVTRAIPKHTDTYKEYDENSYAANCTYEGRTYYICTRCSAVKSVAIPLDPDNHDYVEKTPATCSDTGLAVCRHNSSHTKELAIDSENHTYPDEWTYSTDCSQEGTKTKTCTGCGNTISESYTPGHTICSWTYIQGDCSNGVVSFTVPDNESIAYMRLSAAVSNADGEGFENILLTVNEAISAGDTATVTDKVPFSVDAQGNVYNRKGYTKGNSLSSVGEVTAMTNSGVTGFISVKAKDAVQFTDSGNALMWNESGANPAANVVAYYDSDFNCLGTFTLGQSYTGICTAENTDVTGTTFSNAVVAKHCTRCGMTDDVINSASGHTFEVIKTVAPTCDTEGYSLAVCTSCNGEFKINVKKALGHHLFVLIPGMDATCTQDGYEAAVRCSVCDYENNEQKVIVAAGHKFELQDNGTYYCTVCYEHLVNGDENDPETCSCFCHNQDGLAKFFFKILSFFYKLFGTNQYCDCGKQHYENTSIFEDIFSGITSGGSSMGDVNIGDIIGDIDLGGLL